MSLSLRLNLLVTGVVLLTLLAGIVLVVQSSRQSVAEEVDASARTTMQLVSAALLSEHAREPGEARQILISHIERLDSLRHLDLALLQADGTRVNAFPDAPAAVAVPEWFTRLMQPAPVEYRRRMSSPVLGHTEIVVTPDAGQEILEKWRQTWFMLTASVFAIFLCAIAVFVMVRRSMRPLANILAGLDNIERGDYSLRLQQSGLPELDTLSRRINHLTEVLRGQRSENRNLINRLHSLQEDERKNLARELHDELGQSITAIRAQAAAMGNQDKNRSQADAISALCDDMHQSVHTMMRRLRPGALDDLGLKPSLEQLVDEFNQLDEERFCAINWLGRAGDISESTAIALFRIVQESLTNVVRHAEASEVVIDIDWRDARMIGLKIQDNGIGIDEDAVQPGWGLRGMRERVQALGGHFEIKTKAGGGVVVEVSLPQQEGK